MSKLQTDSAVEEKLKQNDEYDPMKISIIVPCYNVATKIDRCFASLERLESAFEPGTFEVVFVDDCSSDETVKKILDRTPAKSHWRLIVLDQNSGSPSRPRNTGVSASRGEFVFFLDPDDEVHAEALHAQYVHAAAESADLVRTSLEVAELGKPTVVMNRVNNFPSDGPRTAQIAQLIRQQSTTNSSLVRRSLLIEHSVEWPEDLHMGEDTIFLLSVLTKATKIAYLDVPGIVYHKSVSAVRSATQQYTARDLASHLRVWEEAETLLSEVGLSYLKLRGSVGVRAAIEQMYKYGADTLPDANLRSLADFVQRHLSALEALDVRPRVRGTLDALASGDIAVVRANLRPRLLIAGYDLKFIADAIPALEKSYDIRVDEWSGHDSHDPARSIELLAWADVIFCEWLLGNAVWYAEQKRPYQKLIVRMHRFELTRDFGHKVRQSAVDCFISVSAHTAEDMIRTFALERTKVRIVPNFLADEDYAQGSGETRLFKLGLVGSVPKLKGLRKALELLYSLRLQDSRYSLTIYGKQPNELPWVLKDENERSYFDGCDRFIDDHGLAEYVTFAGWVDTTTELAGIGFVVSLSDFESFHVAPAEAFASGNQGIFLNWHGVEYLYPAEYIHPDIFSIRDYILSNRDESSFSTSGARGRDYVRRNYGLQPFARAITELVHSI